MLTRNRLQYFQFSKVKRLMMCFTNKHVFKFHAKQSTRIWTKDRLSDIWIFVSWLLCGRILKYNCLIECWILFTELDNQRPSSFNYRSTLIQAPLRTYKIHNFKILMCNKWMEWNLIQTNSMKNTLQWETKAAH